MGPKRNNRNKPRDDARSPNEVTIFFSISAYPSIRYPLFQMDDFRQVVTNYTCAFANGNQSGTIFVGQYTDGQVSGYSYELARKNRLRSDTITAIKDVRPKIPARDYRVQFVPFFDSSGRPEGNTELLKIRVEGTKKPWHRRMYSNARQEIYVCRGGNVYIAAGYEVADILQRRYQSEQDILRNRFTLELKNLQAEKKGLEDNLQQYTQTLLNIKRKEFEISMDRRMQEGQRDDMKKYFERELKLLEDIVEQQKKQLEGKEAALNTAMWELDNGKASDNCDNEEHGDNGQEDNTNGSEDNANGSEDNANGSEDNVQNSDAQTKCKTRKKKEKKSNVCVVS